MCIKLYSSLSTVYTRLSNHPILCAHLHRSCFLLQKRHFVNEIGCPLFSSPALTVDFMRSLQSNLTELSLEPPKSNLLLVEDSHASQISHMESPESDEALLTKIDKQVDSLFRALPLPEDPMKAALAPTEEENNESASTEMIKEVVRKAYRHRLQMIETEKKRIDEVTSRYMSNEKESAQSKNSGGTVSTHKDDKNRHAKRDFIEADNSAYLHFSVADELKDGMNRQRYNTTNFNKASLKQELNVLRAKMKYIEDLMAEAN